MSEPHDKGVAPRQSFTFWQVLTLLLVAALLLLAGWGGWSGLCWKRVEWTELTSQLGTLALIALFIERTIEVIVAVWRQQRADELQGLIELSPAEADSLKVLQAMQREHTAGTRRIACGTGFVVGMFIALVGVRVLEQWIAVESLAALSPGQRFWFRTADTLLTGAMLAGGTDPIHRVLTLFNRFMDATTRKAEASAGGTNGAGG